MSRPSDHALWTAVIETLRNTVLAHVDDPYAALQTERLIGLAMYARDRGDDPAAERAASIERLIGNDDPAAVLLDDNHPRQSALRALLIDHLDADLATERVLLEHFSRRAGAPTSDLDVVPPKEQTTDDP